MTRTSLGVLECYYGPAWSWAERHHVLRQARRFGYTAYMIGLKDDPFHRDRWRDPYPAHLLGSQAALVAEARGLGMELGFALSPGLDMRYGDAGDLAAMLAKYDAWRRMGVRLFGLYFDDIPEGADPAQFAGAQAEVARALADSLGTARGDAQLIFCPTEYWGTASTPYLRTLGAGLPPEVEVFWTGEEIVSPTIAAADAREVAAALRRPPALWDNYPVNDEAMTLELHIGPLRGRSKDLAGAVSSMWFNAAEEPHLSLVPLYTAVRYARDPDGYDPEVAFAEALADLVADPRLRAAVADLAWAADQSAVSDWPDRSAPSGERLDALRRSARTIVSSADPLADQLRPWALRILGDAGEPGVTPALWPHRVPALEPSGTA